MCFCIGGRNAAGGRDLCSTHTCSPSSLMHIHLSVKVCVWGGGESRWAVQLELRVLCSTRGHVYYPWRTPNWIHSISRPPFSAVSFFTLWRGGGVKQSALWRMDDGATSAWAPECCCPSRAETHFPVIYWSTATCWPIIIKNSKHGFPLQLFACMLLPLLSLITMN